MENAPLAGTLVVVNRFFGEEQVPTGRMAADLARLARSTGLEVEAVVAGVPYGGENAASAAQSGGIAYHTPPLLLRWRARLASWFGYWVWFPFWMYSNRARVDYWLVLTDPPFIPFWFGLLGASIPSRARVVWWTMDLYPHALVAAGWVKEGSWALRVLNWVNRIGLRRLDAVVCLSAEQRGSLRRSHGPGALGHVAIIPPWDLRPQAEWRQPTPLAEEMGWVGKRVVLYAGNLGQAHDVGALVRAAKLLDDRADRSWVFVFAVRGVRVAGLKMAAQGLSSVAIYDYFPVDRSGELLASARVHVVSLLPEWLGVLVPSKLAGATRTGRPVLYLGPPVGASEATAAGRMRSLPVSASGEEVLAALEALNRVPDLQPQELVAEQEELAHSLLATVLGPDRA